MANLVDQTDAIVDLIEAAILPHADPKAVARLGIDGIVDIVFQYASRIPGANIVRGNIFNAARFNALPANAKEIFGRHVIDAVNSQTPGAFENAINVGIDYAKKLGVSFGSKLLEHPYLTSGVLALIGYNVLKDPENHEKLLQYIHVAKDELKNLPEHLRNDEDFKVSALIDAYNGIIHGRKPLYPIYVQTEKMVKPTFTERPHPSPLEARAIEVVNAKRRLDNSGNVQPIDVNIRELYEGYHERLNQWERAKELFDQEHAFETKLAPGPPTEDQLGHLDRFFESEALTADTKERYANDVAEFTKEQNKIEGGKKSDWQIFVAKYAKEHGLTYFKAFKPASKVYEQTKKK
jgi:hypothetical protein